MSEIFRPMMATYTTRRRGLFVYPIMAIWLGEIYDEYTLSPRLTYWGARRVARREIQRIRDYNDREKVLLEAFLVELTPDYAWEP